MLKDIQPQNEKETREGFGEGIHEVGKKKQMPWCLQQTLAAH